LKKTITVMISVFVMSFLLGGAFVASNSGLDIRTAFLADSSKAAVEDDSPTYTLASTDGAQVYSVADLVEQTSPAVVNIEVESKVSNPLLNDPFYRQFFGSNLRNRPQLQKSIGTGFIITNDGYIITNQHVINGAESIKVSVPAEDKQYDASLVGEDYDLDLAVIKIEGSDYPTLILGKSKEMRVGEPVIAIGQPYGLDHTVTTGVISAKERPITIEDRNYKNVIQTDAAINPGNSGGPLLNMQGQVIGINTAINARAQGIGFAIPIDTVTKVLDDLLAGTITEKPFMGISMADVNDEIIQEMGLPANTSGALIVKVVAGSAAEKAGLIPLDVIIGIDDSPINCASDVQEVVQSKEVGDKIHVSLIRHDNKINLPLQLQAKP